MEGPRLVKTESGIGRRRSAAKEDASNAYRTRREDIAEAAVRVFNRLGLQRTSLKAVAEELGVDRASIYYYFSSKEALFDEVVRTVVVRNLELIKRIEGSDVAPARKLRDLITALMSSYGEHYPTFYIFIRENLAHVSADRSDWSREMREINAQATEAVVSIVEQGFADGSFRRVGSARIVAYGIFGVVGWTHRWFRPDQGQFSAQEIGQTYADLILAGLESPYRA